MLRELNEKYSWSYPKFQKWGNTTYIIKNELSKNVEIRNKRTKGCDMLCSRMGHEG